MPYLGTDTEEATSHKKVTIPYEYAAVLEKQVANAGLSAHHFNADCELQFASSALLAPKRRATTIGAHIYTQANDGLQVEAYHVILQTFTASGIEHGIVQLWPLRAAQRRMVIIPTQQAGRYGCEGKCAHSRSAFNVSY